MIQEWKLIEVVDTEYPVTYLIKIDESDFHIIRNQELHISRAKKTHRPKRLSIVTKDSYWKSVHTLIIKIKDKKYNIHHRNMNPLDCRRCNLKVWRRKHHMEFHKTIFPKMDIFFASKIISICLYIMLFK